MPAVNWDFGFLRRRPAQVLSLLLLAQAALFYGFSRDERLPVLQPLQSFPTSIGPWRMIEEGVVEKEILDVLRADDVLTRVYEDPATGQHVSLFVAFFKSQRTGKTPHSPKNCLPGSGWAPVESGSMTIDLPGAAGPVKVNRYIVSKGDERSVVFYWYQSRHRVVASEFLARGYLAADAIRYNRSDTSLVRVVVPSRSGQDERAIGAGVQFIQSLFGPLRQFLPS